MNRERIAAVRRFNRTVGRRARLLEDRLLAALEALATARGCTTVHLETNRVLTEAQALYRSAGYREVEPFNDEIYAHRWFEKALVAP